MQISGPHFTKDQTGATFYIIKNRQNLRVYFSLIEGVWCLQNWDKALTEDEANSLKGYL